MNFNLFEKEILACLPLAPLRAAVEDIAEDVFGKPLHPRGLGTIKLLGDTPEEKRSIIRTRLVIIQEALLVKLNKDGLVLAYTNNKQANYVIAASLTPAGHEWTQELFRS